MSSKLLFSLCAAAALLAACEDRDNDSGVVSDGINGTGAAMDTRARSDMPPTPNDTSPNEARSSEPPPSGDTATSAGPAGDTATTPGGNAGDTAPGTTPSDTPPSPPPPSGS